MSHEHRDDAADLRRLLHPNTLYKTPVGPLLHCYMTFMGRVISAYSAELGSPTVDSFVALVRDNQERSYIDVPLSLRTLLKAGLQADKRHEKRRRQHAYKGYCAGSASASSSGRNDRGVHLIEAGVRLTEAPRCGEGNWSWQDSSRSAWQWCDGDASSSWASGSDGRGSWQNRKRMHEEGQKVREEFTFHANDPTASPGLRRPFVPCDFFLRTQQELSREDPRSR
jgi:hypothetical protein